MMGHHVVKTWCCTQSVIALSSGEAEYYGLVKGASVGLGIKAMLADLGIYKGVRMKTDASAAKGIAARKGLGKIRHIEVSQLWLQDKVADGSIMIDKVDGKVNRADALTKAVQSEQLRDHVSWLNCELVSGRHELMPKLETGSVAEEAPAALHEEEE